jgi:hypothetical protein
LNAFAIQSSRTRTLGTFPSSRAGDYSDVKVVSPYGEIVWNNLGRLDDNEMKSLMIGVVNRCDRFLVGLFLSARGEAVIEALKEKDPVPKWNDHEPGSQLAALVSAHRASHNALRVRRPRAVAARKLGRISQ